MGVITEMPGRLEHVIIADDNEDNRREMLRVMKGMLEDADIKVVASASDLETQYHGIKDCTIFYNIDMGYGDRGKQWQRCQELREMGNEVVVLFAGELQQPSSLRNRMRAMGVRSLIRPARPRPDAPFYGRLEDVVAELMRREKPPLLQSVAVIGTGKAGKAIAGEVVRIPGIREVLLYNGTNIAAAEQAKVSIENIVATTPRANEIEVYCAQLLEIRSKADTIVIAVGNYNLEQRILTRAAAVVDPQERKKYTQQHFIALYAKYAPVIKDVCEHLEGSQARISIVTNPVSPLVTLTKLLLNNGKHRQSNVEGLCHGDYSRVVAQVTEWWRQLNQKTGVTQDLQQTRIKMMGLHGFINVMLEEIKVGEYHIEGLRTILEDPNVTKECLLSAPFERGIGAAQKVKNGVYVPTETGNSFAAATRAMLSDEDSYATAVLNPMDFSVFLDGHYETKVGISRQILMPYESVWGTYFPHGFAIDVPGRRVNGHFIPHRESLSQTLGEDGRIRLGRMTDYMLDMREFMVKHAKKAGGPYSKVLRFFRE